MIVNYKGIAHLDECLSSLYAQKFSDFEIVMVDNDSRDGSIAFVESKFPQVKIIPSESNRGFAGGNNFGLPHCRGEYVFLLNNDTRLHPDALGALAQAIQRHSATKVFACFLIDFHNPDLVDSAGDEIYTAGVPYSFSGLPVARFTDERFVTSACAGAAVYQRRLLINLGSFDEDFFLIFEDLDLSLRARHLGENILFLPSVKVYHKGSASMGGKQSKVSFYHAERNFLWVMVKNYPLLSLVRTLVLYMGVEAWRLYRAMRLGYLGLFFRANWDSLRGLRGMMAKRGAILSSSRLSQSDFSRLLRPGWLRERLALARGQLPKVP